jgi:hypothetical protein
MSSVPLLDALFVQAALENHLWDLGNDVLYDLCAKHPAHIEDDVIIAKMWLIGRAYAAAVERRRVVGESLGDAFYENWLAPQIREAKIDAWFDELKADGSHASAIMIHKKLTDLLGKITGMDKRSFASKYLHFHFPERFLIYDSRASECISKLTPLPKPRGDIGDVDTRYASFVQRCEHLNDNIRLFFGRHLTQRELDKVLLAWHRTHIAPHKLGVPRQARRRPGAAASR